jgi:hypothetical protein
MFSDIDTTEQIIPTFNPSGFPITKVLTNNTQNVLKSNLMTLLQHGFGLDFIKVQDFLRNKKALLTGSSALWIQSPWCEHQNFDGNLNILIEDHCKNNNEIETAEARQILRNEIKNLLKGYETTISVKNDLDYVEQVWDFEFNLSYQALYKDTIIPVTRRVSIWLVNCSPIEIVKQFPINLSRCYWTGDKLVNLFNRSYLTNKTFTFDPKHKNLLSEFYISKYEKRGFECYPIEVDGTGIEDLIQ